MMPTRVETAFSRRDLLRLFGATAGATFLPQVLDANLADPLQAVQAGQSAGGPPIPRGAVIRTLLKDLPPQSAGTVLFHEHLSLNIPPATPPPAGALPPVTDNVDLILDMVKRAGREGIGCIVDGGHPDMGRNMAALQRIAREGGVHVVASGGFYMDRTYPGAVAAKTENALVADLVAEARQHRYGAFGEIGQMPNMAEMTPGERKIFRVVGRAHIQTRLPIFTHNAYGTGPDVKPDAGLRQLDVLESVGVDPRRVAIGHSCCLDDPKADVFKQIAKRGAFVGFDRVTTVQRIMPDEKKVKMVLAFLDAGFADQLLLSADHTGQRTMEEGPGYGRTVTVFLPQLRQAGVSDAVLTRIMTRNAQRFMAFVPPRA
jgi:predicted metal-dependent phosphotriesterase family hydrolase